ncbi:GNAT family N-acetyltransferase [Glaciimonas sp. PAMC28666]|uniref:GNAT family N-acetyltransferase n=1 Tax=Glaciimonas sp. PAMC28666 TaxID=2807626 RepID=UPI0019628AC7|nr:GNAT family N-acetyltransferase [Glaciimonas sp. PAMC28666]QRX84054.1 hypothetical protein JQN73_07590 [Glaciimonas sp. PAMC28666]
MLNETNEVIVKSANFTQAPIAEILSFRKKQYRNRRLDYLCEIGTVEEENESRVDQRSHHFWAEYNFEIIGSLRTTPHPFELTALAAAFSELATAYQSHLEFSRFVVRADTQNPILSKKLLENAFLYARQQYLGVIAVCRTPQRRLFERFGLRAIHQTAITLPKRNNGDYWILEGNCDEVTRFVLNRDASKNHL